MEQVERPGIGLFLQTFKQFFPTAEDAELGTLYDGLKATNNDPKQRNAVLENFKQQMAQKLQTVEVTGKRLPGQNARDAIVRVPTQEMVQDPLRGTTMAARNPTNPQAALLNQFDPEALKASQAAYAAEADKNRGTRDASNVLFSMASGWDQGAGLTRNQAYHDQLDQELQRRTTGAQEALQAQAGRGLQAAATQQGIDTGRMKADIDNAAARAKLIPEVLSAESLQRMKDPESAETMILKSMVAAYADTLPKEAKLALQKLAKNEEISASQLLPVIGQFAPQLQKSYLDALGGQQTQQGTRKLSAEAGLAEANLGATQAALGQVAPGAPAAPASPNRISPATQQSRDSESLTILMGELQKATAVRDATKPNTPERQRAQADVEALTREIAATQKKVPGAQMPPMAITGIGPGGVQIQPRPGYFEQQAERDKIKQNWNTTVGPMVNKALEALSDTRAGKGTNVISKWMPGAAQAELVARLSQIDQASPGVLPPELSKMLLKNPDGTYTGRFDPSMTNDQLKRLLMDFSKNVESTVNYDPNAPQKSPVDFKRFEQPKVQTATPTTNSKGWRLMTDKNGNKAYVSPDGKQFEEVK